MTVLNTFGDSVFEGSFADFNGAAGTFRMVKITKDYTNRWAFGGNDDNPGGADGDTNFFIDRFNDFGSQLHSFKIVRSSNLAIVYGALQTGGTSGPQLKSDGSGNLLVRNAGDSAASNLTIADLTAVTGTFTGKLNAAASTTTLSSFKLTPGVTPTSNMVEGDFYYDSTAHLPYFRNASAWVALSTTAGTVTSVALSMPSEFSVSGSPITSSGTFTVTKANQNANLVFAGPTTGAAVAPTFRSLVAADLPNTAVTPASYTYASITVDQQGRLTAASNGTTPAPVGAKYIVQTADATLTAEQSLGALTSGIMYNTVTSVTGVLSVATGAQMIAGFATQTANTVFSGPTTGADATPSFRALVAADIPNLDAGKITTGQLALNRGGTHADLSGTGAANSFLKQSSAGADITVGTIASADINTALTTPGPVGSGTANTGDFTSLSATGATPFILNYVNDTATWYSIISKRAKAGPAAVTAGIELVSLNTEPYDGSVYASTPTARILAGAAETHSGSAKGTYWDFYVTLATTTTLSRALLIQHDGSFQTTAKTTTTNDVGDTYLTLRSSTGTPAAGFGAGFAMRLDSSTNTARYASRWHLQWTTATDASRKAIAYMSAFDTAERDCFALNADGSTGQFLAVAGFGLKRTSTAGNLTITAGDCYVGVTSTAAARTETLPAASACFNSTTGTGQIIIVKDESGAAATNNITVQRAGTDTIQGGTTTVINTNYGVVRLYCNSTTTWMLI